MWVGGNGGASTCLNVPNRFSERFGSSGDARKCSGAVRRARSGTFEVLRDALGSTQRSFFPGAPSE
eukprot:16161382-Heterocapsa_arctica.AAC.1